MREQHLLSDRIKTLCEEKNMSYYSLSYRSTVPITTIMNIVHCTTKNPGIFTIVKLCDGLGVTIQEFFGADAFEDIERETD
ncbi:MAG: helix-turn-helix transcriptional regulator [Blautia sp.]|nr:helix-turn-helix transcriptional regulator [Blautia sp.]MDY3997906.1 helix-turn-helix transcriptional regulator [Blautia sp.]